MQHTKNDVYRELEGGSTLLISKSHDSPAKLTCFPLTKKTVPLLSHARSKMTITEAWRPTTCFETFVSLTDAASLSFDKIITFRREHRYCFIQQLDTSAPSCEYLDSVDFNVI